MGRYHQIRLIITALFSLIVLATAAPLLAQDTPSVSPGTVVQPLITSTVLVIDVSGSMSEMDATGVEKLAAAKQAAHNFADMLEQENSLVVKSHQAGVVSFNSSTTIHAQLAPLVGPLTDVIDGLNAFGNTNMGEGLYAGIESFDRNSTTEGQRHIILMTDGMANRGLTTIQEFLDGPVRLATEADICIHTVGFGAPGNLDEGLLRAIAEGSNCGSYYYAANAHELNVVYTTLRHQNTGTNLVSFKDTISQGETKQIGTYTVSPGQQLLDASLLWPGTSGSQVVADLLLTDPQGQLVDGSASGASLMTGNALRRLLVENPQAGNWLISTVGRQVPAGSMPLEVVLTTQPASSTAAPGFRGDWGLVGMIGLGVGLAALLGVMLVRSSSGGWTMIVTEPGAAQRSVKVGRNGVWVGRDPTCEVLVQDPAVSRRHCWIGPSPGREGQLYIRDNNSAGGTERNGEKIKAGGFSETDRVTVGKTDLRVYRR